MELKAGIVILYVDTGDEICLQGAFVSEVDLELFSYMDESMCNIILLIKKFLNGVISNL